MMKKYLYIFFICVFFMGCAKISNKETSLSVYNITQINDNSYRTILQIDTNDSKAGWLSSPQIGQTTREYYIASQSGTNAQYQVLKKIESGDRMMSRGSTICYQVTIDGQSGLVLLNLSDLSQKGFYKISIYDLIDYSESNKNFLLLGCGLHEYNGNSGVVVDVTANTICVIDGKYCPTDQQQIAYIEYESGDIFTIKNDSTGKALVTSGQNAKMLFWNPDGNTITFINENSVCKIDKNGMNLIKIRDYVEPADFTAVYFSYDKLVYAVKDGLQIINF